MLEQVVVIQKLNNATLGLLVTVTLSYQLRLVS
jgi:hypothetical protein